MTQNATCPPRVIGCDVGKDEIVVADSAAETIRRLANTPEGLAAFVRRLSDDCLLVCEATGGHETALLLAALDAGVSIHLSRCPQGQGLHPLARHARQNRRHRRPGPRPLRPGASCRTATLAARRRGARRALHPHPPLAPSWSSSAPR